MTQRLTKSEQEAKYLSLNLRNGSALNFADDFTFREDLELERELEERRRANEEERNMAACPTGRRLQPDCKSAQRGSLTGRVSKSSGRKIGRDVIHRSLANVSRR